MDARGKTPPDDWFIRLESTSNVKTFDDKYYSLEELYAQPVWRSEGKSKSAGLVPGGVILGRKSSSAHALQITRGEFECPIISRSHAQLTITPNGHVYVTDLGSLHGTSINSSSIILKAESPVQVLHNDQISLGKDVKSAATNYTPITVRVIFRYPELGSGSTSFGGRKSIGKLKPDSALGKFASKSNEPTIRRFIQKTSSWKYEEDLKNVIDLSQDDKSELGVDDRHAIHIDDDDVESNAAEGYRSDTSEMYKPLDGKCEEFYPSTPKMNRVGIPRSVLYDSEDDADEYPRGSSEEVQPDDDSMTDYDDDDEGPEILSTRENIGAPVNKNNFFDTPANRAGSEPLEDDESQDDNGATLADVAALNAADFIEGDSELGQPDDQSPGEDLECDHPDNETAPLPQNDSLDDGLGVWYSYHDENDDISRPASQAQATPARERSASPFYSPASPTSLPLGGTPLKGYLSPVVGTPDEARDDDGERNHDMANVEVHGYYSVEEQEEEGELSEEDEDMIDEEDHEDDMDEEEDDEDDEMDEEEDQIESEEGDEESDQEDEEEDDQDQRDDEAEVSGANENLEPTSGVTQTTDDGFEDAIEALEEAENILRAVIALQSPIITAAKAEPVSPIVAQPAQSSSSPPADPSSKEVNLAAAADARSPRTDQMSLDDREPEPSQTDDAQVKAEVSTLTTVREDTNIAVPDLPTERPNETSLPLTFTQDNSRSVTASRSLAVFEDTDSMFAIDDEDSNWSVQPQASSSVVGSGDQNATDALAPASPADSTHSQAESLSDASSVGPVTPPSTRKRSLPEEFVTATESTPDSSIAQDEPKVDDSRPIKRARGFGSAIGLVAFGVALGSMGTIAGLMQIAD
ncbi:hypothetical protein CI109_103953 [Kwoniella shandongensis]|uniref:Uncharacterized protein n=1 Tax=Kwoniella shandongensis TaxID=1734106 RepID=A0A5M6BT72_9TREE|nr:uncharacterized protein CI109_005592 [Kwoniella shandongensis]KAA5525997.1 hypothetical protein CI109_005592 [Kwoniella shandongensis]